MREECRLESKEKESRWWRGKEKIGTFTKPEKGAMMWRE